MIDFNTPKGSNKEGIMFYNMLDTLVEKEVAKMKYDEYITDSRSMFSQSGPARETIAEEEERNALYSTYIEADDNYKSMIKSLTPADKVRFRLFVLDMSKATTISLWFVAAMFIPFFLVCITYFTVASTLGIYYYLMIGIPVIAFIPLMYQDFIECHRKKAEFFLKWGVPAAVKGEWLDKI